MDRELAELEEAEEAIREARQRAERAADGVSEEMKMDVMQLLDLFGIPYVVAPMEAEAQCAFLERAGLVEGVITDDSDAFLFGARTVFKNMFERAKYVEEYRMPDVEKELGLSRDDLVRAALLLGSDYTPGVSGVGIVNAVEILRSFPGDEGLAEFRTWLESFDDLATGKAGTDLASSSSSSLSSSSSSSESSSSPEAVVVATRQLFTQTHRAARRRWVVPDAFPSRLVLHAYRAPQVNESRVAFQWREPDLGALRAYCVRKLLWTTEKADRLLQPVLTQLRRSDAQPSLDDYFHLSYSSHARAARVRSRRVRDAIAGLSHRADVSDIALSDAERVRVLQRLKEVERAADSRAAAPVRSALGGRTQLVQAAGAVLDADVLATLVATSASDAGGVAGGTGAQGTKEANTPETQEDGALGAEDRGQLVRGRKRKGGSGSAATEVAGAEKRSRGDKDDE